MTQKILRRLRLDWPLLGKELLEQAARKQMYVIRVAYALVLFGAFCVYYTRHLAGGPVLALGRGLDPFNFLVGAQLVTIFLFLPPLMAGAIAQEKERETLGLLFLTDLTPWELILQKYVGRLIPMLTLLFLSLPLLAVAYSLGGVSAGMLYSSAATLFLTCLWVGALALECSAHEASTFQALVRCWGLCLVFAMCCLLGPFPFRLISRGILWPVVEPPLFRCSNVFHRSGLSAANMAVSFAGETDSRSARFCPAPESIWASVQTAGPILERFAETSPRHFAKARPGCLCGRRTGRPAGAGHAGRSARLVVGRISDGADAGSQCAGIRDHFRRHRAHRPGRKHDAGSQSQAGRLWSSSADSGFWRC